MKIVLTNAHKNPIILECPWMHGEEAFAGIGDNECLKVDIPNPFGGDPTETIVIGCSVDGNPYDPDTPREFYVDILDRDGDMERIWSRIVKRED